MSPTNESKPVINVTPLIDVLLVLLIIFMVAAPMRPHKFNVALPAEPEELPYTIKPNPFTLVVTVGTDQSLKLNNHAGKGTVNDPAILVAELENVFDERLKYQAFAQRLQDRTDLSDFDKVERTVYIKAPKSLKYGDVAKVVDSLKGAGASPISFQLDRLD